MKKNPILLRLALMVILLCVCVQTAFAQDTSAHTYRVIILDEADLLTASQERQLTQEMEKLTEYGNMVFLSVTLQNNDFERHAQDTYYQLCGNEPGALFQIDMGNRQLTLSTSTGMDDLIRRERDSIVDNVYKLASLGSYSDCAQECFREIGIVINHGKIAHSMKYIDNAIFALILGLILNFLLAFALTGRKVSKKKLLGGMAVVSAVHNVVVTKGSITRRYEPDPSGSSHSGGRGGRGGGGGGFSGGFSGGSSSHRF